MFVVDDDAQLRDALFGGCRSAGWRVEAFTCAAEFFASPDTLVLATIRTAVECGRVARRHHAQTRALEPMFASLTAREREVMGLVAAGLLNKQVAGELGISEITVKAHRGNVMRKMGARSFADLVLMAAALGQRPDPFAL
ncbi:MAG TPA: LuxR C-terminal-related transcriptional regulator [Nannocystaceae bacterium]|nr:LuxR C-terminal-related transcriptional regulator [Nannocystaceae bacterium]